MRILISSSRLARFPALAWALCLVLSAAPAVAQDEEAPDPYVNRITFIGNDNVSDGELKRQMRTKEPSFFAIFRKPRLNERQLARDIAQIEGHYHAIGYYEATARLLRLSYSADRRFVDIVIDIDEGQPTLVRSIRFSRGSLFEEKELRKGLLLSPGKPYNASLLNADVYSIKAKYFDKGYLGVSVRDSVTTTGYDVDIHYNITPGTQVRIRRIEVTGNHLVKRGVIDKELTFRSGDVCRLSKLLETQRNLFETGLFTIVDISPENLDPLERTVDISIRLRERKAAYVEAGFGVGNVLGSRVSAEWGTRNLFGTGRTLRFKAEYAFDLFEGDRIDFGKFRLDNTFYRYDAVFQQRRILGTKVLMGINMFLEDDATVQDIEVKTIGAAIGGSRELTRYTDVLAGFSVERIERSALGQTGEKSSSHILGSSISRDTRDFILNPRRGNYRVLTAEVAGGILGGDNDFYTLTGTFQRYHPLSTGLILAWRLRGGYGNSYGQSAVVPVEKRYFLGGSNSVRGYRDNSLGPRAADESGAELAVGGEVILLANLELRHPIPLLSRWNFSGAVFFDSGNVWENPQAISLRDFRFYSSRDETTLEDYRYSIGLGIRYNTPVGPIRLDYGYAIKQDERTDAHGRFYLSLGQIF